MTTTQRQLPDFASHPAPFPGNVFRAICRHIVDGDTYDFIVDVGFTTYLYLTVRLRNVDTPEIFHPKSDAERTLGLQAQARATQLLQGKPCLLTTYKDVETFGRYVADVQFWNGTAWTDLAGVLIAERLTKADVPA